MSLGHPDGSKCWVSKTNNKAFTIIDSTGIHEVTIDFCACPGAPEHSVQLLRCRLFPATFDRPNTAATLHCLDQFDILTYESKLSVYDYYNSLARLTDNTGLQAIKAS